MDSLEGLGSIHNPESDPNSRITNTREIGKIFKIVTLVFCGITGCFAVGFFGVYYSLADPAYEHLLFQNSIIGYVCAGSAVITIILAVVFQDKNYVFFSSTAITSIIGSFQFIVFVTSEFGEYPFSHYQYFLTLITGVVTLLLALFYLLTSERN